MMYGRDGTFTWSHSLSLPSEIFRITNLDHGIQPGVMKRRDFGYGGRLLTLSSSPAPQRFVPVSLRMRRYIKNESTNTLHY